MSDDSKGKATETEDIYARARAFGKAWNEQHRTFTNQQMVERFEDPESKTLRESFGIPDNHGGTKQ